jgi:hypothetical protein
MAASVWMALMNAVCWASPADTGRLSALTIPVVTVESRPRGAPMATTCSPTTTRSESPNGSATRPAPASAGSMRSTAMS